MTIPDENKIRAISLNDVVLHRCLQRYDFGHCTFTESLMLYAAFASREISRLKSDAVDSALNCTCGTVSTIDTKTEGGRDE